MKELYSIDKFFKGVNFSDCAQNTGGIGSLNSNRYPLF